MVSGLLNKLISPKNTTIQKESFDVHKLNELTISTDIAKVDILTHEHPRVDIQLESYEEGPILKTNKTEKSLTIIAEREWKGPTFVFGSFPKCHLQIQVPKDIADHWDISTTSGKISAAQLVGKSFRAKANSGTISLVNITADKMNAHATSGEIIMKEIKTQGLEFMITSGEVKIVSSYGDISGRLRSGDVQISRAKGENLELKATSGSIILKEVYMKNAVLQTTSGEIEARHFWTEKINVSVRSGDINLQEFRGAIIGSANSGDINLAITESSNMNLKAGSGDIRLVLPEQELNARIDIKTGSGEIISNIPINIERRADNRLLGKSKDGENLIHIRTGSGDVEIRGTKPTKPTKLEQ